MATLDHLALLADVNGAIAPFRNLLGYVNGRVLAADVPETIAIPSGATSVVLTGTTVFYVKANATAAVPTDLDDGTSATVINSSVGFALDGVTSISVIASAACVISAEFAK